MSTFFLVFFWFNLFRICWFKNTRWQNNFAHSSMIHSHDFIFSSTMGMLTVSRQPIINLKPPSTVNNHLLYFFVYCLVFFFMQMFVTNFVKSVFEIIFIKFKWIHLNFIILKFTLFPKKLNILFLCLLFYIYWFAFYQYFFFTYSTICSVLLLSKIRFREKSSIFFSTWFNALKEFLLLLSEK